MPECITMHTDVLNTYICVYMWSQITCMWSQITYPNIHRCTNTHYNIHTFIHIYSIVIVAACVVPSILMKFTFSFPSYFIIGNVKLIYKRFKLNTWDNFRMKYFLRVCILMGCSYCIAIRSSSEVTDFLLKYEILQLHGWNSVTRSRA